MQFNSSRDHVNDGDARLNEVRSRVGTNLQQRRLESRIPFKTSVQILKKILLPHMQLSNLTLEEIDDFLAHMLRILLKQLKTLRNIRQRKTLSIHNIDCAVKLCLPPTLYEFASTFAKNAVLSLKVNRAR